MVWPVAALAVFLLGFVVVYGTMLQARVSTPAEGSLVDDAANEGAA